MPNYCTIIHRPELASEHRAHLSRLGRLQSRPGYWRLRHERPLELEALRRTLACDVNTLPLDFEPEKARLLVTDLDSTLVAIETIDELAATLGRRAEVAAITAQAMAGELDFAAALSARVALLEGLEEAKLAQVFETRMKPAVARGASATLTWLKQRGFTVAVVSGGFTFFTERLKALLPIDYSLACVLEIKAGRLTGRLQGPIVDRGAKAEFLADLARKLGISPKQAIAIGDGANDILMLTLAGLGVAYHAHAIARAHADAVIDRGDWHDLRYLLRP
ncbi:phosphoserine phosphatase SerB [Methylothermus subterraneus]